MAIQESRLFTNSFASFNPQGDGKTFFGDASVRMALAQAIDRQRLINEALAGHGDADFTPIPTSDWAYSATAAAAHPYDPVAAAKALDAAGWVIDPASKLRVKNGNQFKATMVVADSYPNRQIADGVARQLMDIGVEIDVKALPASQLVNSYLIGRNYEMALVTFDVGSDPDQYTLWHSGIDTGSLNFAYSRGWGLIDKDLEDGRAAVDPPSRLAAYIDFQTLMVNAAPAIFLYAGRYDYAVSQRVHGVHMNKAIEPSDRFQYVTDWYVNTTG
jgi:peptide/nickel transport system substrate-binding protein